MSYRVKTLATFEKKAKRLIRKYPSLKEELLHLIHDLKESPTQGVALGKSCYKIRIAITSKGKGKSGGGRVITFVRVSHQHVYLLTLFDKSEQETLSDQELATLLSEVPEQ